jgi:diguanylate cyclase (GGDEF)-like protein/PAS domain S-box-containing protein
MRRILILGALLFGAIPQRAQAQEAGISARVEFLSLWLGGAALLLLSLTLAHALVSRRRLAEKNREIESSQKRLQAFLEASGDFAYLKDEKFRYIYANKGAEWIYDIPAEKILGKDDYAIADADFADGRRRADLEALAAGVPTQSNLQHRGRLYRVTKFPVPLSDGKTGIGTYARDVTEEARAARCSQMESRRLQILSSVVERSFQDAREQFAYVLEEAVRLTDSRYGFLFFCDETGASVKSTILSEGARKDSALESFPGNFDAQSGGVWAETVRTRKPVLINDFNVPNASKRGYPEGHLEIRRFLSVPVIIDEKIVATVDLANKTEPYEDTDIYELRLLMTGVWNDVRRREALSRLSYERARYLQTLVSIGDGVMVTDAEGKIEILNNIAENMTGWKTEEVVGRHFRDVFNLRFTQPPYLSPVSEALRTGAVTTMASGTILVARDGTERALEDSAAPIRDETGKIVGVVLVFRDVTQKKAQIEKITYLSFHDALTGLYNRGYLTEAYARLDADAGNLPLSVVMGDLNSLKLTNDIFGHAAGDLLLEKVADVFQHAARPGDVVGRWGGDEFVALLPRTDETNAADFIARVKTSFAQERVKAIRGSISMGYATKTNPKENAQVVFAVAEDAMYTAKSFERDDAYRSTVAELIKSLHRTYAPEEAHSDAVRALSVRVAEAMGLPAEDIRKTSDAGYLHDIGKIALDASALDESRPLTSLEWNEMRRHPIVGYRILNTFDDTVDIAEPVLSHHERWDGGGYPRGLKGDEIPLLARIIAVAEAYDRVRRNGEDGKHPDPEAALDELRANAGAQFDPAVVEALARAVEAEVTRLPAAF